MKKIIQVVCPPAFTTGGPEALHQLVHSAREQGIDARLVYLPKKKGVSEETPDAYKIYNIKVDKKLVDSENTLILVPEKDTWRFNAIKHATKAIWWLSIDNFYISVEREKRKVLKYLFGINKPFNFLEPDRSVLHFAQSEYAREYLSNKGLPNVQMLTDYLRDDFIRSAYESPKIERRKVVTFNPLKGFETTQKIISACPDIEFIRLEKMTPKQVIETLKSATVYMDFGNHPGRDRIPREAAMCGCVVVTGQRGSAGNSIDIPIPSEYKVDENHPDFVTQASSKIRDVLNNTDKHYTAFNAYRHLILEQKNAFFDEVSHAFG